jgi:hypothetical protein
MSKALIACDTINDEVRTAMKETGVECPVVWIESGLHNSPDALKEKLQQEVDKITGADDILLAFGFCGNAIVGLSSKESRIIIPKVDDCITLVLGAGERRRKIINDAATYFITQGWMRYDKNIWNEYKYILEKYGKENTDYVYELMFGNYKRLGVIDTGAYDVKEFLKTANAIAADLKLEPELLPGTISYIEKLLTGPYDDKDFIIIEPGESVELEHVSIAGKPVSLQ